MFDTHGQHTCFERVVKSLQFCKCTCFERVVMFILKSLINYKFCKTRSAHLLCIIKSLGILKNRWKTWFGHLLPSNIKTSKLQIKILKDVHCKFYSKRTIINSVLVLTKSRNLSVSVKRVICRIKVDDTNKYQPCLAPTLPTLPTLPALLTLPMPAHNLDPVVTKSVPPLV